MGKYFVTGASGCIGGWVAKNLVEAGHEVTAIVRGGALDKLRLIMDPADIARINIVKGDIADADRVLGGLKDSGADRIIHLAAMQLPLCKAAPALGAKVNVEGTVNIFEAAKSCGVSRVVFSSSAAVYGLATEYAVSRIPHGATRIPHSLYGVYKLANEWLGRVYFENDGITSLGLIPSVAYGPLRDQGMTSTPTTAIREAVKGNAYEINFGGRLLIQYVDDIAKAFVKAADCVFSGSDTFDIGGESVDMGEVTAAIEAAVPEAKGLITYVKQPLPFPEEYDNSRLAEIIGNVPETPIAEGVRKSAEIFRSANLR